MTITHFINGERRESLDRETFANVNPWTQTECGRVALGTGADVDAAVHSARTAFDNGPWRRMGYAERGAILHRLADLIEENVEVLAAADSRDMGKPLSSMSANDVPRAAKNFRFFADHARLSKSDRYPMDSGHHAYCDYDAVGVVAAIAPWNYPLMLGSWKVAPALAWGNTVVLKPAEQSPSSATLLAELATAAGIPPGVLNVVQGFGPKSAGEALTRHPGIDRITFTGDSNTGRVIARAAAENLVPVSLELGGKGANIVFEDANLEDAVMWSDKASFTNAGQICLAGSRIYVQRSIFDAFVDRLVDSAKKHVVGDPKHVTTTVGPLSSENHFLKVRGYVENLDGKGRIVTGGVASDTWAIKPTLIVDAPADAPISRNEVFGPVATITAFDSEDEAIRLANDTRFGLTAMLFTENLGRAHRVSAALRAGTVWVNCFFVRDLRAPFGGRGDSGIGREGGDFSREFFTEPKAVMMSVHRS